MADIWHVKEEKRQKRESMKQSTGHNALRELFEKHNITEGLYGGFTVDTWTKTDQNKFRTAMKQIGYKDQVFLFRLYKLPFDN